MGPNNLGEPNLYSGLQAALDGKDSDGSRSSRDPPGEEYLNEQGACGYIVNGKRCSCAAGLGDDR